MIVECQETTTMSSVGLDVGYVTFLLGFMIVGNLIKILAFILNTYFIELKCLH